MIVIMISDVFACILMYYCKQPKNLHPRRNAKIDVESSVLRSFPHSTDDDDDSLYLCARESVLSRIHGFFVDLVSRYLY